MTMRMRMRMLMMMSPFLKVQGGYESKQHFQAVCAERNKLREFHGLWNELFTKIATGLFGRRACTWATNVFVWNGPVSSFLNLWPYALFRCNDPLECQDKAEFHFTLEHAFAGAGWLWFGNILLDFGKWGYSGYGCFKNHDMITEMDMGLTSDISHTNRWLPDQADPSWGWSDGGFRWRCIIQNSSSHAQL